MDMTDLEKKINGQISKKKTREEILKEINQRLQTKENQKARKLLAQAAGHYRAYEIVRARIIVEIESNGSE